MLNHITKHQKTKIFPLRWIGNFLGAYAGNHLVKSVDMDEDNNLGLRFTYHVKMWKILNWPYKKWGTYYVLDTCFLRENMERDKDLLDRLGSDYDEDGIPYWEQDKGV